METSYHMKCIDIGANQDFKNIKKSMGKLMTCNSGSNNNDDDDEDNISNDDDNINNDDDNINNDDICWRMIDMH